jgi:hypothetical protein
VTDTISNEIKVDKTALSYWFPKLVEAGIPVPRAYLGLVESGDSLGSLDERVWRHRFDFWRAIDAETLFFGLARACA